MDCQTVLLCGGECCGPLSLNPSAEPGSMHEIIMSTADSAPDLSWKQSILLLYRSSSDHADLLSFVPGFLSASAAPSADRPSPEQHFSFGAVQARSLQECHSSYFFFCPFSGVTPCFLP